MDFLRAAAPAVTALVVLSGCSRSDQAEPPPPAPAAPTPAATPPPPPPPPPLPAELGRSGLIAAAGAAASAAAAGSPAPEEVRDLAGRRFKIRLPFGCFGPSDGPGAGYVYDAARKTLKVTVAPQVWTETPWARDLVSMPETEAIEGFWVRRPWLDTERCPPRVAAPEGQPAAETLGLVRVFGAEDSRIARRSGRPYEFTAKVEPDMAPGAAGLRLALSGRIASPENAEPVRCRSLHPDRPPVCLVLVEIDRVAIEGPEGAVIAEWSS